MGACVRGSECPPCLLHLTAVTQRAEKFFQRAVLLGQRLREVLNLRVGLRSRRNFCLKTRFHAFLFSTSFLWLQRCFFVLLTFYCIS